MNSNLKNIIDQLFKLANSLKIPNVVTQCFLRWRWFALSLVIVLAVATLFILKSEPKYNRTATVLIKSDDKSSKGIGQLNEFNDMGLFTSSTNVDNELVALKSPALMLEVIKRLNLDIVYRSEGFFHNPLLYGKNLPISVSLPDIMDDKSSLTFDIKLSNGNIELSKIKGKVNGREIDDSRVYKAKVGTSLATSVGQIVVKSSPYYKGNEDMTIHIHKMNPYTAIGTYSAGLTASLNGKYTTIIDISYEDVSTQRAEDIINTLILIYNENWVKDKNQIAISTSQFINDRLAVIEKELGNVDNDISSYKSANRIPDLVQTSTLSIAKADATSTEIVNLNNQIYMAKYIRSYIISGAKNQLLPAVGIQDNGIAEEIQEYNKTQLQRNSLVANSSEKNPLVADLDNTLSSMKNAILVSIDNHLKVLNTQMTALKDTEKSTDEKIVSNPEQAQYLLSVERQQKVKESLYLYLLQKREENELSQAFTAYNTRIITPPMGSQNPTAPKRNMIYLVAIILGLAIPAGLVYIVETANTKVRGRKDLETLTIPFVGEIPLYITRTQRANKKKVRKLIRHSNRANDTYEIVVKSKSKNIINEAFRVVRTNLELMNTTQNANQIIMYTSANPGSGKTFISMNSAVSFAIKEKKTIAVDLDLRRASLSSYVESPNIGLTNYLTGRTDDWHSLIVKEENNEFLDVLPVGTIPPNPSELLFSPKLETLIQELKKEYEFIVLDCPPVDIVADTSIISKWADITVFVIRVGLMERELLPIIENYYKEKKFNNMSIVLNGTTSAYGYGYGYGY
ncbi:MAG: polysaccharide biosynthesis tyrosine autokinase, partial [Bacteroidales bacterium]|nr:polysaccharide biosynthesis tyrosine autokinase [Bacteroidales bacterium]